MIFSLGLRASDGVRSWSSPVFGVQDQGWGNASRCATSWRDHRDRPRDRLNCGWVGLGTASEGLTELRHRPRRGEDGVPRGRYGVRGTRRTQLRAGPSQPQSPTGTDALCPGNWAVEVPVLTASSS